ncbi:MAG TPA: hypothetical protein VJY39_08780 [Acidisphaera sp.]|nr:hypothetical protein [Acidisphaera sp.]
MSPQIEEIALSYLRRLDAELDRVIEDLAEIKRRMTAIERHVDDMLNLVRT